MQSELRLALRSAPARGLAEHATDLDVGQLCRTENPNALLLAPDPTGNDPV